MDDSIKKPNFFIIGAPKCGNSSLNNYLREHPDIFFPEEKGPSFFCTDLQQEWIAESEKEYLTWNFKRADGYKRVGDGVADAFFSKEAVPNILDFNPESKFIILTRNPVDMFHSWHSHLLRALKENVKDPQQAWELQEERKKGKSIPPNCKEPKFLQYGEICKLGKHVRRILKEVNQTDKVKIIEFDNFVNNTEKVYKDVLTFLNLEYDGRKKFPAYNKNSKRKIKGIQSAINRLKQTGLGKLSVKLKKKLGIKHWFFLSKINEWNQRETKRSPISSDFRRELKKYFAKDQKLLENILKERRSNFDKKE